MAHAGTIDLGPKQEAKRASGGSRWPALVLIVVITVATVAAVWFATASGLVSGTRTATPAADRSYDRIEQLRGVASQSSGATYEQFLAQHDIARLPFQTSAGATYDQFLAQHDIDGVPQPTSGTIPMTSGTFHANSAADPAATSTPVKRDRVGGP